MMHRFSRIALVGPAASAVLAIALLAVAGCKNQPARTDQQITADVQAKISGEGALNGQDIQVSVVNGVATLSGTVTDEASRSLAGNDSGTVNGVRTVVNNLTVHPGRPAPAAGTAPSQPAPSTPAPRDSGKRRRQDRVPDRPQEAQAAQDVTPPQPVAEAAPPPPPPPPPAPPRPVVKEVTLPEGTVIPIRVTETLDSKTAQPNDVFHGSLAGDIGTQGVIAIPRGSAVVGRIVDAKEAAHFKGAALLSVELTELTARGKPVTLVTDTFTKQAQARGKNTAEKAGGGAALGAIIGALAGGGKGAAIGGLAGGAAGTGVNAATRGQQAVIPTETLITFHLQSPVTLTVTIPPGDQDNAPQDPQLQRR
ncbi:MAG TPA: BON domain-containing protein [Candidatus Sulfopaludibacter sp.]|nr:BON domain-containing protein [Candidatus Sulfopaludibacter sp.]